MHEINKLLHEQDACLGFSHSLFVSEISLARCSRSYARNPVRKIPYARLPHEVISIFKMAYLRCHASLMMMMIMMMIVIIIIIMRCLVLFMRAARGCIQGFFHHNAG